MDWNLKIDPNMFNMLDDPYKDTDIYYVDSYLTQRQNEVDIEELCMTILLKKEINIDELLKQVNRPKNILTILDSLKLTIDQRLKLVNKLRTSTDIFLASTSFTQDELYSLLQISNIEDISEDKIMEYKVFLVQKNLCALLLCYLYLYPSKKIFHKEQEKLIEAIFEYLYTPYCLVLMTTDRFLSNFSSKFKKRFYTKLIFNINKRLFIFIDKIPEELYEECLTRLLQYHVPAEILLYSKCFHKDYEKFLQFIDINDFYSKMYERRLLMSYYTCQYSSYCKDILTTKEYQKCIQYFFGDNQTTFYKILPHMIDREKNKGRKAVLNSYILMKELKE